MGLKEKMRLVRNVFLTHREMGQSEALYRIIPSMHLTDSNIGEVFLNTGRNKSKFLKKISEDEANAAANVVTIADSDGLYVETSSLIDKHQKRPSSLKWISPMQFSKRYATARETKMDLKKELESNDSNQETSEEDETDDSLLPSESDNTIENDFIIHHDKKKRRPRKKKAASSAGETEISTTTTKQSGALLHRGRALPADVAELARSRPMLLELRDAMRIYLNKYNDMVPPTTLPAVDTHSRRRTERRSGRDTQVGEKRSDDGSA